MMGTNIVLNYHSMLALYMQYKTAQQFLDNVVLHQRKSTINTTILYTIIVKACVRYLQKKRKIIFTTHSDNDIRLRYSFKSQ